jgi:predicted phosphohydrolase
MNLSFDIISNLNLTRNDKFTWEGKPTSLFCLIPGNISNDLKVVHKTLTHLSTFYQGIFYIDGSLEHDFMAEKREKIKQLNKLCKSINNTVYLHNDVIIMNGVALVGINGWYDTRKVGSTFDNIRKEAYRNEDLTYLQQTIKKMQIHVEVKDIVVLSNSIPDRELFYGKHEDLDDMSPNICLSADTEKKTRCWVFNSDKTIDATLGGINYVSNPFISEPYWPKRIEIKL